VDAGATLRSLRRAQVGSVAIDRLTFPEALDTIAGLVERRRGGTVFTPNVDHVVLAEESERFRSAYAAVDLALADGMPVVWASRMLGSPVPEKVSGSDLAPRLMELAEIKGWRVYLLGGANGVAARAARRLRRRYEGLSVVGTSSPRVDLREPPSRRRHILDDIRKVVPDLVLVGLGSPKQELWIHEAAGELRPAVLLGVGAAIDFLAGQLPRCPAWMSEAGLEWLHRLAREPRRLWRRYLLRDPKFLSILLHDLLARRGLAAREDRS
jgi:N-acetylglucosaminyldiphosphoundecaprenol N-acetyl-beta-D-mannosaminyltransferase